MNKKRKRNQKRFYNVVSKKSRRTESKFPQETVDTDHHNPKPKPKPKPNPKANPKPNPKPNPNHGFDDIPASSTPPPSPSNSDNAQTAEPQETELLDTYFKHQATMQVQAKTVSALREKHMAPSKRKQMFELMKEKGLYKKFPKKRLKKFETWLKSPSGGQLKCTRQIVSEISRFVMLLNVDFLEITHIAHCIQRQTFLNLISIFS